MIRTAAHRPAPPLWRPLGRRALFALCALLLLVAPTLARSQAVAEVDPPDRAARLSEVVGQVWLYSPDADEWVSVARNRPLTTGDRLATDNDGRAEITLGSTTLRLDAATELEIVLLDDSRYALHLHRGSVAARVRSPQALPEFEMNIDEGRFRLQAVGRYRFDRFEQASDLTVLSGQAVFEGRNSALPVQTGQHAQFWLDSSGAAQYSMVAPVRDAFASWNDDRDAAEDRVATSRYVSPEMTGAGDLDRYGRWEETQEYGPIWQPAVVPSGWAPYSTGHWAWIRPWGWTWVDDAPWGFAPFHYGRWVHHRDRWAWAPGTYVRRPVYAPALVAWMGGSRGGVSISIGAGGPAVGWFPLAPREVYLPSYRTSPRYVRNINFTHVGNVNHIDDVFHNRRGERDRRDFANRKFPHAVTIVPQSVLTQRQPVGPVAAQLRNNAQVRAMVADDRSLGVVGAPPVTMPTPGPRRVEARPRPPFEGRAPGGFAGRPEGGRADAARQDGRRADGRRGDGNGDFRRGGDGRRADGDFRRDGDGRRADGDFQRDGAGGRGDGERPDRIGRPDVDRSDRPARPAAQAPVAVPTRPGDATSANPAAPSPMRAGPDGTAIVRPPRGQIGREPALGEAPNAAPTGVAPPPWSGSRRAQPAEPPVHPGFPMRERRSPPDGANAEGRPQFRSSPAPATAPPARAEPRPLVQAPRTAEPIAPVQPRAVEPRAIERPVMPVRPVEAQRPPPVEAQRPPPAEAQRPPPAQAREPRMGRPESPRGRGDDRDERRGQNERVR
jgi:hypothetical protein